MTSESRIDQAEPGAPPTISVIVPAVNEAARLASCFAPVLAAGGDVELILVDGGSRDESAALARTLGATVVLSPVAQRAAQMNLGAAAAQGEVLVFLHVDTRLPGDWMNSLRDALQRRPEAVGGVFRRRFLHSSRILEFTCWLADQRARWFGWYLGDQTIFVRRQTFTELGGYQAMKAFEDLEFSFRLKRLGPTVLLSATAHSSGRRFDAKGPVAQTLADIRLTLRFLRDPGAFADDERA